MEDKTRQPRSGFTLIELLVGILIVSILVGVAIPSCQHYAKKSYYSEIVQTADRYSLAVDMCLHEFNGKKIECNANHNGVPPDVNFGVGQVNSVKVINGVITVTPKNINGITSQDTYILTPIYKDGSVEWISSGGGCESNLAPDC